jgi:hypothetical protein
LFRTGCGLWERRHLDARERQQRRALLSPLTYPRPPGFANFRWQMSACEDELVTHTTSMLRPYMARIEREHQIAMRAISATAIKKERPFANAPIGCPVGKRTD